MIKLKRNKKSKQICHLFEGLSYDKKAEVLPVLKR